METRKHKNSLEGVEEYQFTEQKFLKWCQLYDKNPNTTPKPKYLIVCDICQKVNDEIQFRKHSYKHKIQKNKYVKFRKVNENYECKIVQCDFQPTKDRKELIIHYMTHTKLELLQIHLEPNQIFSEKQFQQYKEDQNKLKQQIQHSYFEISKQKLIEKGRLWINETTAYKQIHNKFLEDTDCKDIENYQALMKQQLKIFHETYIPEVKTIIEEAQSYNIFIEVSSKLDLKLKEQGFIYQKYDFQQLKQDKHLLNKVWGEFKILKYLSGINSQYQNKLIGVSVDGQQLVFITRKFSYNMKYLMDNRADDELLYAYILGLVDAVRELHINNLVHRDIKPENLLINKEDNFEVFFANYYYTVSMEDNSKFKPNAWNKYINLQLQEKSGSKFWDIYSIALIMLEYIVGQDKFKTMTKIKNNFKNKLQQYYKSQNIKDCMQELLEKVLIQEDHNVTLNDIADMFLKLQQ